MSVSSTTTKLGLPLPQPGDVPDWYDLTSLSQKLDDAAGANNGLATLDANGNVAQLPAAAVPNTRTIAGLPLSADITLAQLIVAGLCPAPESGTWTPTLYGITAAGSPTYTQRSGQYYKIGKLVLFKFILQISSKGGASGIAKIGGLPFAGQYGVLTISESYNFALPSGNVVHGGRISNDIGCVLEYSNGVEVENIDISMIADNLYLAFCTGWYITP